MVLRIHLASPIGAESAPGFAYKRRARRSAINISCDLYIAQILLALRRSHRFVYFPELAYNLGSADRKRKYGKIKMKSK
jgi:hypothetical protein